MAYQLIAVDMDGTLLNSNKEITPRTEAAVTAALARRPLLPADRAVHGAVSGHALCYHVQRCRRG